MLGHNSDKLWLRSFVVFLILANIVNSAFNITFTYLTLVTHYGHCFVGDLCCPLF
jgi:hypothetical protein